MRTRSPSIPTAIRAGDCIGSYRVQESLGEGGVAFVYKAVHEVTSQIVALKTVRAPNEGLLASIRRETSALERLRHPGVVRIFDGGLWNGRPWYAMELLDGATLRSRLRRRFDTTTAEQSGVQGSWDTTLVELESAHVDAAIVPALAKPPHTARTDLAWFLSLMRRVCEPLAYIHGEGVVHRDLSPSNIFVRDDETPVLLDFGLVWHLFEGDNREVLSVEMMRAGTIAYMAPEQARGERIDARADLFSLGCIMYEGVTGELPFAAQSWSQLMRAHEAAPQPPSSKMDGVPAALDALIMGLLQLRRRDRIGHALDVASVLADLGAEAWPTTYQHKPKAYLYRSQLVNRVDLLGKLERRVLDLKSRTGSCLLVSGESGIGKTSFVSEVARLATLRGVRVITGQCIAVGLVDGRGVTPGTPFYPLLPLLHAVADRCVSQGAAATAALLGERAKVLGAIEPSLRQLSGVDAYPEPPEIPGEAARRRLIDAFAETLSAFAAEQPTMLVIEDLQWADNLTIAFLASLSTRYYAACPVVVLATLRAEEQNRETSELSALSHVESLRLSRLEEREIGAIAAEMMGAQNVPDTLARLLTGRSSGNPFFAAEYLRAAVDAGLLYRDQRGLWKSSNDAVLDAVELPRTLTELLARRMIGLSPAARAVAEGAAVLARNLDLQALDALARESAAASDPASFDECLRELTVREVLESMGVGQVRFVHDKLREVIYQAVDAPKRTRLHAICARLLEQRHAEAGTLEAAYSTLAHHFEMSGQLHAALKYFDLAGRSADAVHANREAVAMLSRAKLVNERLGGVTSSVDNARRERLLGLNALALGDVNAAFAALSRAAQLAGRPWPRSRARLALRTALALGQFAMEQPLRSLRVQAALSGEGRELLLEAARAYERMVVVNYYTTGDSLAVALSAFTNLLLAERAGGASAERALGYATISAMFALGGADSLARFYGKLAVRVGLECGDDVAHTWVLMNVALAQVHAARWLEMRRLLQTVRETARRLSFNRRWEEATSMFSTGCLLMGRFEESKALNDEHLASVERADPQSKCWATVRLAELSLLSDDVDAALAAAQAGMALCQQGLARGEWVYALGALALARFYAGDLPAALETVCMCEDWIEKGTTPTFYHVVAYAAVIEIRLAAYEASTSGAEKRTLAKAVWRAQRRLEQLARSVAGAVPRAALWRGLATLRIDGDRRRAARHLKRALSHARRVSAQYDEALVLGALGEYALDGPALARSQLASASALLARVGAKLDSKRIDALRSNDAMEPRPKRQRWPASKRVQHLGEALEQALHLGKRVAW